MEFVQALDPNSLVLLQSGIAFICSPFVSPSYNLPISLFGIYALNYTETYEPLRALSGFIGVSILFDIIWLFNNSPAVLIKILLIINWFLKVPTFLSLVLSLKQRGDQFGSTLPGPREFGGQAQTVWTMPTPSGLGAYTAAGGDGGPENGHSKPLPTAPSPAPAAPTMPHSPTPQHHQSQPAVAAPLPGTFTI
ncbi:hypothetical protein FRC20_010222 [Serendipita sp. 405]|nr:hypothetical protein FRC20_010222 [Serendipita sp. 405]